TRSWPSVPSRTACPRASTSANISTLTSSCISMALRPIKSLLSGLLALLFAIGDATGQTPGAPLRLSFADAVTRATGGAPAVSLAGFRSDEARGRVREARSPLLPSFSANASWVNRTFNKDALGLKFPNFPGAPPGKLIGPFDVYDLRVQLNQTLLD